MRLGWSACTVNAQIKIEPGQMEPNSDVAGCGGDMYSYIPYLDCGSRDSDFDHFLQAHDRQSQTRAHEDRSACLIGKDGTISPNKDTYKVLGKTLVVLEQRPLYDCPRKRVVRGSQSTWCTRDYSMNTGKRRSGK
jgi:hypothetical protein